jgi:hydroxymethylpyrimidine kinase/phosphomethylpyrimidine kinase/thiamine-phosphate diphosphorylase
MIKTFPKLKKNIGLYPVVDSFEWVSKLAKLNISTIQLRIKNTDKDFLEEEIKSSIKIAEKHNMQLFINDYVDLAIKHNAYGVHLGQEDIQEVCMDRLLEAGIRLGVSTHNKKEVDIALKINPSYIAIGPVYFTNSKPMKDDPQGIQNLKQWVDYIAKYNIDTVAIGGINLTNIADVGSAKPSGVAVISAICSSGDYIKSTSELQQIISNF